MKKTLVALAALASVSAFAQSSVTLSGNMDVAYGSVKTATGTAAPTINSNRITSTTSVIKIVAVEDLGGGTKMTAQYGIDPRAHTSTAAALGRDESFIGLSGNYGNLRLGSPNSIGLAAATTGNPFGTGVGGGYARNQLDMSAIRYNSTVRYDSPVMGGLTLSALRSTGNTTDQAQTLTDTASTLAAANEAVTEAGFSYANGPLNVAYAHIQKAKVNAASGATPTNDATHSNLISANYAVTPTLAVYAGLFNGDRNTTASRAATITDVKGGNVGVKYTMGKVDLLVGQNNQKFKGDTTIGNVKVTGVRADYNFSKTSAAYAALEKVNAVGTTNDQRVVSLGLRKSF